MSRLGLLHPTAVTTREGRMLYEALCSFTDSVFGNLIATKLPSNGALLGPSGVVLHTPKVGRAFMDLATAVRDLPHCSMRVRAITQLTVAFYESADFEVYTGARLAQAYGLTQVEIQTMQQTSCPSTFNMEEVAASRLALELCSTRGVLAGGLWDAAVGCLGREQAIALVHLVAYTRYVCTLGRGFDIRVPANVDRQER